MRGIVTKKIVKKTGGLRNKRTRGDHPGYSFIKVGQNTEKGPGNLRKLAVTQTSVEDHQLTPVWKKAHYYLYHYYYYCCCFCFSFSRSKTTIIIKCALLIMKMEKAKKRKESSKNPNNWRKGKLQELRNIGSRHYQPSNYERIIKENTLVKRESFSRPSTAAEISLKR